MKTKIQTILTFSSFILQISGCSKYLPDFTSNLIILWLNFSFKQMQSFFLLFCRAGNWTQDLIHTRNCWAIFQLKYSVSPQCFYASNYNLPWWLSYMNLERMGVLLWVKGFKVSAQVKWSHCHIFYNLIFLRSIDAWELSFSQATLIYLVHLYISSIFTSCAMKLFVDTHTLSIIMFSYVFLSKIVPLSLGIALAL